MALQMNLNWIQLIDVFIIYFEHEITCLIVIMKPGEYHLWNIFFWFLYLQLTHFNPIFRFYTPENVFRWYRNGALG